MKRLLLLACLLGSTPALHAQKVILNLDRGYPEDQFYFLTYNDESRVEIRANAQGHDGKSARATWHIESGPGALGYVGFGYFHRIAAPPNPFPDLSPYTHLSLWYTNTSMAAGAEHVAFRFELYEDESETDPAGETSIQTWIYESRDVLTTPTGWTQLLIPLTETPSIGDAGFSIPPGGFRGDGVLDLDKIRHWGIVLVADGVPVGTVIEGVTLFDQLAAVDRSTVPVEETDTPFVTAFGPAYPNPFAAAVTFDYTLERAADVSLRIYDVMGREVAVPVPAQLQRAGSHQVVFSGDALAAGTYVGVLTVGNERLTRLVTRLP